MTLTAQTDGSIEGYAIRSEARPVPPGRMKTLQRILLARGNFQGMARRCTFNPNIVYCLHAPDGVVDVLICHGCDQASIRSGELHDLSCGFDDHGGAVMGLLMQAWESGR